MPHATGLPSGHMHVRKKNLKEKNPTQSQLKASTGVAIVYMLASVPHEPLQSCSPLA